MITASSLVEPPAIAIPRASQDETDDETGTREARRNSTKESCQQAHTYSAHDRRRDANKGRTPINPISGGRETQSPSRRRRPQTEHTTTRNRKLDQNRPSDRPSDRATDRGATYLADERLQRLLELAGAAQVGLCVGYDGFRDGSRPSRPPHGHARCSRRGRTRLRGRERPPAQSH